MTRERFNEIMTSTEFNTGEKFICQGEYGGYPLTGFGAALWNILCAADGHNLLRASIGFPEHVDAFRAWRQGELQQRFENEVTAHAK